MLDAALADIAHVDDVPGDGRVVEQVGEPHLDPPRGAVGAADRQVGGDDRARVGAQPVEEIDDRVGVVGIDPREVEARQVGGVAAEEVAGRGTRVLDLARVADHEDRVGRVLHEGAEAFLALALSHFGELLVALPTGHERDHDRGDARLEHREAVTHRLAESSTARDRARRRARRERS